MNRASFWLASALLTSAAHLTCGYAGEKEGAPGDRVFGTTKVVQFHLTMTANQFAALAPAGGPRFGPPGFGPRRVQPGETHRNTFGVEFPWTGGDLAFGGESFKNVGVRYKGNYTFMATAGSLKKSMKLDFNRNMAGQKLDGLTMLNLHCGVSDSSRAREAMSYQYFRDAGVPAPRTCFAELTLTVPGKYDKEFVGVYTLVEQVNKGFLKRHFEDGKGLLLKPEGLTGGPVFLGPDWRAYEGRYKPEDQPTDEQKNRLIEFARLIDRGTDEKFAEEIGGYLDVEYFLKFIAANALLSNLDSYLGYGHNYYLYLVPSTNKFAFIPWDLDYSMGTWPAAGMPQQQVRLSIHHPHAGENKLIDRLFAIRDYKARYLAILTELTSTSFTRKLLLDKLAEIEAALTEPMAKEATAVAARKEGRAGGRPGMGFGGAFGPSMSPKRFIELRTESVAAQLAGRARGFEPRPVGTGFGPPPGPGRGR